MDMGIAQARDQKLTAAFGATTKNFPAVVAAVRISIAVTPRITVGARREMQAGKKSRTASSQHAVTQSRLVRLTENGKIETHRNSRETLK